ncbi:hypothetical protein JRQ81_004930 [Phrynocephalus forsythii]|uniref:Uncharacterized protein n=1 Tax=Phrynocephalus forsythii TaxID=171643 RepID=A0A9Q0XGT0_9SAUR|nr:hypothetical protein JRQ81_004930 [Phrynocephalus forsythii]
MEAEESQKEKPKKVTPYHCHLDPEVLVRPGKAIFKSEKGSGKTLEEQLNSCKDTEPAIGLQYITEYQAQDLIYECNLCGCQAGLTNMFMHVLGVRHKQAYLTRHYPEMGEITGRGSAFKEKLKKIAEEIEQKEGRKKIMVSMDIPTLKYESYSVEDSDSLVTWFSEDDIGVEKKEEEKAKSEDSDKKADTKTNEPSKSDNEATKDQNSEQLALPEFSDSDPDEFDNEDLLTYLKNFEIMTEEDATFILKVTQKFTSSLVAYRQKVSERKNTSELNLEERCDRLEQTEGTSLNAGKPKSGFSDRQPLDVHSSKKRKASSFNADGSAKNRKHGTFESTYVPSEQLFSDVRTQDPPSSEEHILNPIPGKSSSFQYQSDESMATSSGPSTSENDIMEEFFNSIRNMEFDEVAATLHQIAALNPSFSGMNVEKVLKILTESGHLKSKNSTS